MKKSTLYAPRLRGDIDLGLEPSRVSGDDKKWAEILTPGGLLPGQTPQGIYEENLTAKYRIGTRRVVDERVFRYGQAGSVEALRPTYGVCAAGMTFVESAVVATARSVGVYTVTCTSQAAVAADAFAEGWLAVSSGTNKYPFYRIKSNTADLTGTGTFIVTLWDPLISAISANDETITLFPNKYRGVRSIRQYVVDNQDWPGFQLYVCWVGVPLLAVQAGYWCWLQTAGPQIMSGVDNYGAGNNEQRCMFYQDGSVQVETGGLGQLAGYTIPNTYWSATGHDLPGAEILIDLKISP